MSKHVCVIGLGYIGLPTSALLANSGYRVTGLDVSEDVINTINQGGIHIVEPDLDAYVRAAVASGSLKASLVPEAADIFMICVPTPFHNEEELPQPNLDYVESAAKAISPYVQPGNLIILESTSPVGTTELIEQVLNGEGVETKELYIAYCPERVLPGRIMVELTENDRIVGGINTTSTIHVAEFYRSFVKGAVLETNSRTAEMSKLVENSYRDVNIAFANELSMICEDETIAVDEVIALANHHPRVNILQPGCGVGGHCISVDPWFIVSRTPEKTHLIKQARLVNDSKSQWSADKIASAALSYEHEWGKKPVVACLGLSYKPDIDDLRESPAYKITRALIDMGIMVLPVEPHLEQHDELELVDLGTALDKADILVALVRHKMFIEVEMPDKLLIDFCGLS